MLVARPLTEVEHELSRLLLILALIGGGGIVLAAILGTLVARTALAPIARFTRRTETLTGNLDLSRRLEVEGHDELARLAESFNATLDGARALGAGPAPPDRRRKPRAANPDRLAEGEHPDPRRGRAAAGG